MGTGRPRHQNGGRLLDHSHLHGRDACNIEYNASSKLGRIVHEEGKRDVTIMDNSPASVIDNVHVSLENQKL
eukprot:3692800-Pleurochrysis_carterae.AAC.4